MMAVSGATMQSAAEAWKARIEAHGEQSLRALGDQPEPADFWSTLAAGFRADPRRRDDPVVNLLAEWITPETTVLDVGGDAGRYALPLALRCRRVTVVEPSPSMVAQLREGAKEAEIENISSVEAGWEDARVGPADLVLCANVVYGVKDIAPFLRKLDEKARERVVIVAWMDAPPSIFSPLWRAVHGEDRVELPALPDCFRCSGRWASSRTSRLWTRDDRVRRPTWTWRSRWRGTCCSCARALRRTIGQRRRRGRWRLRRRKELRCEGTARGRKGLCGGGRTGRRSQAELYSRKQRAFRRSNYLLNVGVVSQTA